MSDPSDNMSATSTLTTISDGTYIRPIYSFIENDMWRVEYPTKAVFIIDTRQLEKLINCSKRFVFHKPNDTTPTYGVNYKRISLLEFFHGVNPHTELYTYKNDDNADIRSTNICFTKPSFYKLTQNYNVVKYLNNEILVTRGRYAGETKNYMCEIKTSNDETQYLMLCNQDKLCKLCPISYEKILDHEKKHANKIVWTYQKSGYILGNNNLYIHQIITGCFGNGKGTKTVSVDHIDQDPLNNTYDNLRVVSQEVQRANQTGIKEGTKRARNKNAQPFPEGITHDMLIKYVSPRTEAYGTTGKTRTYFVVEGHPGLDVIGKRQLYSSKSEKVSNEEKLAQAVSIVESLDAGTYQEKESALPKYYSLIEARGKPHLVYEKRCEGGSRMNVKMILPEDFDLAEQVERLSAKVSLKYPDVGNLICT
jgi:hypothetical protein